MKEHTQYFAFKLYSLDRQRLMFNIINRSEQQLSNKAIITYTFTCMHLVKLYNCCYVWMCFSSHPLHFLLDSMAFIRGTQRDTVCPLALTWLKPGHMLALTFTGPSHSSASEVISIFWMMSLRRLCCFSSMLDISFILEKTTLVHVVLREP